MPPGRSGASHPAELRRLLIEARNSRSWSADHAAARIGVAAADLRSLEAGAAIRADRRTLLRVAEVYELPAAEVVAAAGGVPCAIPEVDDFLGSGCPAYCACGWTLSEHSAKDLATSLWQATRMLWHPLPWPRDSEAREVLAAYRSGLADLADDVHDARDEVSRREAAERDPGVRRPLIDLLKVSS